MTSRLQIQFLGLNEGDDPKNLPPGTLLRAENVAMDKARRLRKRWGIEGLVKTALSGSNPAAGKRLLTNGTDTAITDGQTVWTYASPLSKWNPIDRVPSWRVTKRPLAASKRSVTSLDSAIYGNMLITVYTTGGNLYAFYQVDDLTTGAPIVPATLLSSAASLPRVLVSGTKAYLLFAASGGVKYGVLDLTTLVLTAPATLISDGSGLVFDATIGTPTAGVPTLYVVYELASGTDRIKIASFTVSTMVAITSYVVAGRGLVAACVTFGTAAQKVTFIYSISITANATLLSTSTTALASAVGPTEIAAYRSEFVFVAEDDATNVIAGWTRNTATNDHTTAERLTTSLYDVAAHGEVAASRRITFGAYAVTRPWKTSSRWFTSVLSWAHPYTFPDPVDFAQPSSIVVEIETAASSLSGITDGTHPHVSTLENYTGWYATAGARMATPVADADGTVWLAVPYREREPSGYATDPAVPIGWNVYRLAASEADTFRAAPVGPSALLAGGAPAWLDGASTMPYGFVHAPQIISVTASAGGAIVAGDYSYVATYAWPDANGVLHRSAPSAPVTGTTETTNLSLIVKVSTSSISPKQRTTTATTAANPVFIELWRTTIGATGPHYRLSMEPTYSVLSNDPRAGDVSLTDIKSDANISTLANPTTLASRAQLYTDLGELENIPPPSLITVVTHQGRLVGIGPDLRTLWFSKDSKLDPTIAPGFNEALTLAFAHDKTALASLDTTLVVFGEDTIDIVQGDGPDDKGDQNTWQIQSVQTDVGCVNPRSVVATPVGIMFESRRGLDLLDRNLNVTDVLGRNIVDTLTTYPTITSAVLVAEQNEVRFTCDDGTNGIVLAYDYLNKVWFTRKYTDASDTAAAAIKFVDAALIDGVYTLLTAGGQVYRESATSYLDGGTTYVSTDIILAPISAQPGRSGWSNDNLAWQRFKDLTLMGTSVALHDLSVSFAHDYATSYSQTHTFAANATGTPTAVGPLEKARVTAALQKCQAIQIRIRDLTPTGTAITTASAGPVLESLSLRVAAKDGPAKTSSGQQA